MEPDDIELNRFKKLVTVKTAHQVDQNYDYSHRTGIFSFHMYDPTHKNTVINSFRFRTEKYKNEALEHVKKCLQ
jgi:hypothetical protein